MRSCHSKSRKSSLKEIIEQEGIDEFLSIENRVIASIGVDQSIIATGGSAVYGLEAMQHLKAIGTVVYLKLSFKTIKNRLRDARQRGVALSRTADIARAV